MRIALGGIATESCTFSPLPTQLEDFRILEGAALLDAYPFLERTQATLFPTLKARALPGGPVEATTYQQLKSTFLERLRDALPLDGLYLDMHGAMNVEGMDDAEGDWFESARQVVGNDCLLAASYDLHGNVSARVADHLDILCAYRTAPHIDAPETREKTWRTLLHCLSNKLRPSLYRQPVPVILPGERTSTEVEPAKSLYASLAEVDKTPGILDISMLVGYVWADEPRASATAVVTGTDEGPCQKAAAELATRYWNARQQFDFEVPTGSIGECIDWALEHPTGSVFVSDSGDNPTAGGVGDRVDALEVLLEKNAQGAILGGLAAPPATAACYRAGVGVALELTLGSALAPGHGPSITVRAEVRHLDAVDDVRERQAVVQIGGVSVILTARRRPFHYLQDFTRLGLEPRKQQLTIVKAGYLEPELRRAASKAFLALTPGAVDQHIERLPYKRVKRPVFPLDKDMRWTP